MKEISKATHEGEVVLGPDIAVPCAVLKSGERVLTQSEFVRALGRTGNVKVGSVYDDGFKHDVPVFLSANNLRPFLSQELLEAAEPLPFRTKGNVLARGYRADFLTEACNVFIEAEAAGVLAHTQLHIAERCRLLMRAYATVGITALIDEATGYQEERARSALQQILEKYLTDHKLKWAKTFPDDFYKEIFRLRGWDYSGVSFRFRPSIVGKYTNDTVYERLAPGVLEELQQRNPINKNGNRSTRHHQWLTEDHGVPELKTHLSGVIALMKASSSWHHFIRLLNKAFPKPGMQFEIEFNERTA